MTQEQINTLNFVTELNRLRLNLRQKLDSAKTKLPASQVRDSLLKMQLLLHQNKDTIDVSSHLKTNTVNLMRMIKWQHEAVTNSKSKDPRKFDVNWHALMGKSKNEKHLNPKQTSSYNPGSNNNQTGYKGNHKSV